MDWKTIRQQYCGRQFVAVGLFVVVYVFDVDVDVDDVVAVAVDVAQREQLC